MRGHSSRSGSSRNLTSCQRGKQYINDIIVIIKIYAADNLNVSLNISDIVLQGNVTLGRFGYLDGDKPRKLLRKISTSRRHISYHLMVYHYSC